MNSAHLFSCRARVAAAPARPGADHRLPPAVRRRHEDSDKGNRTMKYLLTGATGFIGERVARQLAEAGHQVVAVVRTPSKAQELADLGIAIHRGDVTDKQSMRVP